jgi:hypothetical protein
VQGVANADSIQKTVAKEAEKIYPEIYYRTEVYERDGKQCVRVDIERNGLAPHFGGQAWVRRGSQTIRATEQLYQQMIAQRQGKERVLLEWLNKEVTVHWKKARKVERPATLHQFVNETATLVFLNAHWVTFRVHTNTREHIDCSEPMPNLILNWDDGNGRLQVEVDA